MRRPNRTKPGPQGERDVGRDKLLEAARALFRAKVSYQVSRQDIAKAAGVVPGLVTYHFPTNRHLVLAATHPVLAEAISKLFQAIDSSAPCEERLREVVLQFLNFAHHNASLLDIFIETAMESGDSEAGTLIHATMDKLGHFFSEAVNTGLVSRDANPRILLLALWGMCRLIGGAQPYPLQAFDPEMDVVERRQAEADLILNLVLHGVGTVKDRDARS